jgi:hypothetical protein
VHSDKETGALAAVPEPLGKPKVITDMYFTFNILVARIQVLLFIVLANACCALEPHPALVPSTPMEAALDALRTASDPAENR